MTQPNDPKPPAHRALNPDTPEHDALAHPLTLYLSVGERRRLLTALQRHAKKHRLPLRDRRTAILHALHVLPDPKRNPAP